MPLKSIFRVLPLLNASHISQQLCRNRPLIASVNFLSVKNYATISKYSNPSPFKPVYYGSLTPQIKAVKVFSLSSSIVGIISQPFLYTSILSTGNVPAIVACYSFIGFFTFVTPLLLHLVTKKYVTQLVYNENTKTYIADTVNFFCITKKTEFKLDDVVVPEVPGMFTSFVVNGKPLFLDPRLFENPTHYSRIMGYDKPMDFKLYETPPVDKKPE